MSSRGKRGTGCQDVFRRPPPFQNAWRPLATCDGEPSGSTITTSLNVTVAMAVGGHRLSPSAGLTATITGGCQRAGRPIQVMECPGELPLAPPAARAIGATATGVEISRADAHHPPDVLSR